MKVNLFANNHLAVLTLVLAAQATAYYVGLPSERVPPRQPLALFPSEIEGWGMVREFQMEPGVQEILRADDTLSRVYAKSGMPSGVSLFIAYFQSQRFGQAPHSPKNCLPGAGFEPSDSGFHNIVVPGRAEPIEVNRYVVTRGEERNLVLYWYQSRDRVVASEYAAKVWLVLDSIRYHRSDTALVRVVVPALDGRDDASMQAGVDFIRSIFPLLSAFMPT